MVFVIVLSISKNFRARRKYEHGVECDQCQMLKMILWEINHASNSAADVKLRFIFLGSNCKYLWLVLALTFLNSHQQWWAWANLTQH